MSELKEIGPDERAVIEQPHDDGLPLDGCPVVNLRDTKSLPDWFLKVPPKGQAILALLSLGLSCNEIERNFGLSDGLASYYKKTYLGERVLPLSPADAAAVQTAMIEARALQVVFSIDKATIDASSLKDRAYSVKTLASAARDIASRQQPASVEFTDLEARMRVRISK